MSFYKITGDTVLMYSRGVAPTTQLHLSSGKTLFPISSLSNAGETINCFGIPRNFIHEVQVAGLETRADMENRTPQGPSSARPLSPDDGDDFIDWTLGLLVIWSAKQAKWVETRLWQGPGT